MVSKSLDGLYRWPIGATVQVLLLYAPHTPQQGVSRVACSMGIILLVWYVVIVVYGLPRHKRNVILWKCCSRKVLAMKDLVFKCFHHDSTFFYGNIPYARFTIRIHLQCLIQVLWSLNRGFFYGRINFGLWKIQVNDVLLQSWLHNDIRKHFQHGWREAEGSIFESWKCNSYMLGKECSCECVESIIRNWTSGEA